MPRGRAAQTASSLLWGPAAGRLKAVWGLRAWHPRLGPALAKGHLIESSTRWLLLTLDRGHRQLDLTQGAPLLTRLRPEPQLTDPRPIVDREAHGVCGWLEALRPFLWHCCPPTLPRAQLPATSCCLVSGCFPQPRTHHSLQSLLSHSGAGHALAFWVPPAQDPRLLHLCGFT